MSKLNLVELLTDNELHSFHGGIHPRTEKQLSNGSPLRRFPLPQRLYIPLRQHLGESATLCVAPGDQVLKGQALTYADSPRNVPVHAPTSGTIIAIREHPSAHPSALPERIVELAVDGNEQWREQTPCNTPLQQDVQWLRERIRHAGIAGMGGAGFPSLVKLTPRHPVQALIINGAECEPYITADDRLMREHAADIVTGIQIITRLLDYPTAVIAIEDDKPEAIAAMEQACVDTPILVKAIPAKYPSGGERQLVKVLTGLEVPSGEIPANLGVVIQNVGTVFAIKQAIVDDHPLIERVVTVTGKSVTQPGNYWVLTGTPVSTVMAELCKKMPKRVIMGGPMMGFELASLDIPVVKTTNCLIAPGKRELHPPRRELPCIRCGACAEACPVQLLPQQLLWYAKSQEHDKLNALNLSDCIECGICAYVCPSEIPLVSYYRQSKAAIRQQQQEKAKSDHARDRFEARKARLENEKAERMQRHQQAARPVAADPAASEEAKATVAAAVARAKARQQPSSDDDIAAAREARKAQARAAREEKAAATPSTETTVKDENKDKVAAAIARAKARRQVTTDERNQQQPSTHEPDDKKAKVAAAIARAKAKRQQQNAAVEPETDTNKTAQQPVTDAAATAPSSEEDDKKAKVAAAIARAKAKRAAALKNNDTTMNVSEPSSKE